MNHEREILHYFHDRLTNAVCEGINSMIQAAKRKARGYNTFEGFAAMICLVAGKLKLPVPDPFQITFPRIREQSRFFFFRQHSRSYKVGIVMEEVMRLEGERQYFERYLWFY